jgi:hypothetical protein
MPSARILSGVTASRFADGGPFGKAFERASGPSPTVKPRVDQARGGDGDGRR